MSRLRLTALAIFFAFSLSLAAQVVGGTISGTVTDSSGAVIPNVHVLIHNDDTGTQRSLITNSSGEYAAPSIPVGNYTLSADAPGFTRYTRGNITLTIGQSLNLNLALSVSGTETVNVHATQSVVNTSTEQTTGLIDSRQVKQLPLNGRSYDQLILLNPGTVNYTNQRSGGTGTSNSSVGSMFSVSGRRPQDNLFLLNGIEYTGASLINNTPGGTSGQLLGIDGIREFNVVTDTYSAAYGKRDGAQVSIVTPGGTNQLHGTAYEFLRNSYTSVSSNTPAYVEVPALPYLDYGRAATDVRSIASINTTAASLPSTPPQHRFHQHHRSIASINTTYDLPLLSLITNHSTLTTRIISGWSLSSIISLTSGYPFSPQLGYNPTGSGDSRNPVRPNVNPTFTGQLYNHGSTAQRAAQYFNPNAFSAPAYGTVGNARRDSLTGPGYSDWDFSLLKSTQLAERTRLQFRAEFFNILNHTNLSLPNEVVFSNGPTQGTTANQTTPAALGTPGVITSTANTSRQIQLALKLLF